MNKTAKILLIALASLVLVGAIAFAIYYVNVNAIRFDHVEQHFYSGNSEFSIPYFGNKLTLGGAGVVYDVPFNLGFKNLDVYDEVNNPIHLFTAIISTKYDSVHFTDYEVINDGGKTLTVTLNGTADDGGETVPIEKVFVFDIEDASLDKLPVWTNRTEEDDEVYQYLVSAYGR
ncbi:MAG: hypothetical protein J1F04_02865 [Oscillospiraceae bacterium]|nr:hypothetical protein [Oscillospiraceae bacterium]